MIDIPFSGPPSASISDLFGVLGTLDLKREALENLSIGVGGTKAGCYLGCDCWSFCPPF